MLKEGDTVKLGNTTIKVYVMGGHTPGSVSYEFTTHENGKAYKSFVMGGPGGAGGLEAAEQFEKSAERLNKFLDVQVAVNVHSWLNGYHYPNGGILERDVTEIDLRSPTHYFFLLKNGEKKDVERGKET